MSGVIHFTFPEQSLSNIVSNFPFYWQADINLDDNMEDSIKEAYGLPGNEDFTEALNYIQRWVSITQRKYRIKEI